MAPQYVLFFFIQLVFAAWKTFKAPRSVERVKQLLQAFHFFFFLSSINYLRVINGERTSHQGMGSDGERETHKGSSQGKKKCSGILLKESCFIERRDSYYTGWRTHTKTSVSWCKERLFGLRVSRHSFCKPVLSVDFILGNFVNSSSNANLQGRNASHIL